MSVSMLVTFCFMTRQLNMQLVSYIGQTVVGVNDAH